MAYTQAGWRSWAWDYLEQIQLLIKAGPDFKSGAQTTRPRCLQMGMSCLLSRVNQEPRVNFNDRDIQHNSLPLRVKYTMRMYRVISSRHVFKPHINGISYFSSNYRSQNSKVSLVICSSFLLGRVRSVCILMKHGFLVAMTDAVCTTFCVYSGIPLFSRVMIKKNINCQGIESLRWVAEVRALASHRFPASYKDKNSLHLLRKPWKMWL